MELTITSALALFTLIILSTFVYFIARRLKAPYTVLLVLVGLLLVPVANAPYVGSVLGFIDDMVLTPELLFFIFLPILIFESGFNMSLRKMLDSAWTISFMAIGVMSLSVLTVATLVYFILPLIGIQIPFIVALLFGAIISPTDPVAALSMFKELGVPRKLALIFEGESLFNDGTAMALFLVILSIAMEGFHGTETVVHGVLDFFVMIVLGVVLGLVMAAIFSRIVRFAKSNEFVTVTLLLVSAHLVFVSAELINESGVVHVSSIIAATISSLFLGNYARHALSPKMDDYIDKVIEHVAFVANSLVFLMAGLLFASSGIDFGELWLPVLVTIGIVALARMFAVYAILTPLGWMKLEAPIPPAWKNLLAWASLRGALSIIIVLLIPEDFTVPGWDYIHAPHDFLLAMTIGCILATLFVKAPLIKPLMQWSKINNNTPLKMAHEADLGIYYLLAAQTRLRTYTSKGFLSPDQYQILADQLNQRLQQAEENRLALVEKYGRKVFDQSLHLTMVHAELAAVKRLFINDELSEGTYRIITSKLNLQQEKIEKAQHDAIDPKQYTDRKDIFDRMVQLILTPFHKNRGRTSPVTLLEYYRAQMIMARKAVRTVEHMQTEHKHPVFLPETYKEVGALYKRYKKGSAAKANNLIKEHREELTPHIHRMALRSLSVSGSRALEYLRENGLLDEETEHDILEDNHFNEDDILNVIEGEKIALFK